MKTTGNSVFTWAMLLAVYLSVVYAAFTAASGYVAVLYVLILSFSFRPLFPALLKTGYTKYVIAGCVLLVFVYAYLSKYINAVDRWGDEITEIRVAGFPFGTIYQYVKSYYFASPPFGFWSLWFWNRLVGYIPVDLYEIFYRIPYMMIHVVSSVLFGVIICKSNRADTAGSFRSITAALFAVALFTFFVNPVSFFYSIVPGWGRYSGRRGRYRPYSYFI